MILNLINCEMAMLIVMTSMLCLFNVVQFFFQDSYDAECFDFVFGGCIQ